MRKTKAETALAKAKENRELENVSDMLKAAPCYMMSEGSDYERWLLEHHFLPYNWSCDDDGPLPDSWCRCFTGVRVPPSWWDPLDYGQEPCDEDDMEEANVYLWVSRSGGRWVAYASWDSDNAPYGIDPSKEGSEYPADTPAEALLHLHKDIDLYTLLNQEQSKGGQIQ